MTYCWRRNRADCNRDRDWECAQWRRSFLSVLKWLFKFLLGEEINYCILLQEERRNVFVLARFFQIIKSYISKLNPLLDVLTCTALAPPQHPKPKTLIDSTKKQMFDIVSPESEECICCCRGGARKNWVTFSKVHFAMSHSFLSSPSKKFCHVAKRVNDSRNLFPRSKNEHKTTRLEVSIRFKLIGRVWDAWMGQLLVTHEL